VQAKLTKAELIEFIGNMNGHTKNRVTEILESLLELIKSILESGEDILISGFGKFRVNDKAQRKGRNSATGEDLRLAARRVVTFRCSGKLRVRVNGL